MNLDTFKTLKNRTKIVACKKVMRFEVLDLLTEFNKTDKRPTENLS